LSRQDLLNLKSTEMIQRTRQAFSPT
jgi:hypothetical protein